MRYYCGIDIGLQGGIVVIDDNSRLLFKEVMPTISNEYNISEIRLILGRIRVLDDKVIVGIESPIAFPGQASQATLKSGIGFGLIHGLVSSLDFPYVIIAPNRWTKVIHAGLPKEMKAKDKSRLALQRMYPTLDLRASDRSKKIHEGLMDALLIATYLKREGM